MLAICASAISLHGNAPIDNGFSTVHHIAWWAIPLCGGDMLRINEYKYYELGSKLHPLVDIDQDLAFRDRASSPAAVALTLPCGVSTMGQHENADPAGRGGRYKGPPPAQARGPRIGNVFAMFRRKRLDDTGIFFFSDLLMGQVSSWLMYSSLSGG